MNFWDTSAIIPLSVDEPGAAAQALERLACTSST